MQSRLWQNAGVMAVLAAIATPATAQPASPWNDHPNAKVRLLAGEGRMLGVELQLAPGWKTYWRMPGDAGVPPSFDWAGSKNIKSAEVLYPVPQTMPDQGGTAIGYKSTVIFPVRITLEKEAEPTIVAVEFSFGVCKDICIPVDSKLTLALDSNKPWPAQKAIGAFRDRVPRVATDLAKAAPLITAVTQTGSGDSAIVRIATARDVLDVYAEAPDSLFVPLARNKGGGHFELVLAGSSDARELVGKALRLTAVTSTGGVEVQHVVK